VDWRVSEAEARAWREECRTYFYEAKYGALPRAKAVLIELRGRRGTAHHEWNALINGRSHGSLIRSGEYSQRSTEGEEEINT
jgi:hypothetical protein